MAEDPDEAAEIEDAQAGLREGIQRAKELVSEAKLKMGGLEADVLQPPNPAPEPGR